jgi:hypothetical protein
MPPRSGPRWPVRRRASLPAHPGAPGTAPSPHRPSRRGGHGHPIPPDRIIVGVSTSVLCLALLYFWGSWTYTGPEFVSCVPPVVNCTAPLQQIEVPVLGFWPLVLLAVTALYPLAAIVDAAPVYRAAGCAGALTVALGASLTIAFPAPRVDLADGGFLFPIPTVLTVGVGAFLDFASAVVILGLLSGVNWPSRRRKGPPPTAEQVLAEVIAEVDRTAERT